VNLLRLRWGLLLVFLVPVLDLGSPFLLADDYPYLVRLMLGSMAACALLLTRLHRTPRQTLWAWLLLALFLQGFYLKSFLFARNVNSAAYLAENPELTWVSIHTIAAGFHYITLAFVAFCVAGWVALDPRLAPAPLPPPAGGDGEAARLAIRVAVAVTLLSAAAGIVQAQLGIGVMGVESTRLPLRLDTLIIRSRTDVAPVFLYLAVWILDGSRDRRRWSLVLALLGLLALLDGIISTSRGSFVRLGLPVLFLWILTGRLTRRRVLLMGLVLAITILLHPLFSAMRLMRMQTSLGLWDALATSVSASRDLGDGQSSELAILGNMANRVSGAEGVWFSMDVMPEGIDVARIAESLFGEPVHVYYTRSVVGITLLTDFRAPGVVGAFMLLGGTTGLLVFPALYVAAFSALWNSLAKLRSAPVALAVSASWFLYITMEGALQYQSLVSLLAVVALGEWSYRRYLGLRAPALTHLAVGRIS
jgi:hypothetical protein